MSSIEEHHIAVNKTARYYTLRSGRGPIDTVWIACHGYKQAAGRFVGYCSALAAEGSLVVAPEGLSRFYVDDAGGEHTAVDKVGASWMTREDREAEIKDYVAYLDKIADTVGGTSRSIGALGFSQGVATVCRWALLGDTEMDHIILWGGFVPRDLDLTAFAERLGATRITLVVGDRDELFERDRVAQHDRRLREAGLKFERVHFDGGHHLNQRVLRDIVE